MKRFKNNSGYSTNYSHTLWAGNKHLQLFDIAYSEREHSA